MPRGELPCQGSFQEAKRLFSLARTLPQQGARVLEVVHLDNFI